MSGEDAIAQANAHAAKTIGAWPAYSSAPTTDAMVAQAAWARAATSRWSGATCLPRSAARQGFAAPSASWKARKGARAAQPRRLRRQEGEG